MHIVHIVRVAIQWKKREIKGRMKSVVGEEEEKDGQKEWDSHSLLLSLLLLLPSSSASSPVRRLHSRSTFTEGRPLLPHIQRDEMLFSLSLVQCASIEWVRVRFFLSPE